MKTHNMKSLSLSHTHTHTQTHRLDTEPLAALPPLSLPFRAAVLEAAAAAGSMFWEAMSVTVLFC